MEIAIPQILSILLTTGVRVSGLMLFAPFFGSSSISPRIKVLLTIAITAVLCGPIASRTGVDVRAWPVILITEFVLGIALGLTTMLVFDAAQLAGQVLSIQMGYSLINILDPNSEVETTVVAMFHQTIAILIFLRMDVHHWIIRAIAKSFEYLPPASISLTPSFTRAAVHVGGAVVGLGLQLAAPVLAATLLADIAIGFLGKASPQLQLLTMGPAIKSVLGVVLLGFSIAYWPSLFGRFFESSVVQYEQMLHLLK